MKRSVVILWVLCLTVLVSGCGNKSQEAISHVKPVKVMEVKEATYPIIHDYTGTIDSKELKKYSFKIPGKVGRINVEEGQAVHKGEILAQLDTKDLDFALEAAQNTLIKAQNGYDYTNALFERVKALHEVGGVSKQGYDNAKLELDLRKADLDNAQVNYNNKMSMLQQDARIVADVDGYVVDTIFEEGEVVGAGYPVVAIRTGEQIVNVGLSQEDVRKVEMGLPAKVIIDDETVDGEIATIEQVPDLQSRTYNVEISLPEKIAKDKFYLGAIADISLKLGEEKGIMIPITSVMSNGQDYVYVVVEEKAVKQKVELGDVIENNVSVKGITSGSKLVIEGMKSLEDGYEVTVKQ